ncbi:hypothetical protein D9611_001703 [Ephemerocybe angulata]|uniref:Methyltransferase domain-containing protein n=1 Tax=Ephemerocybe angulata TaxID=980116 RepID=A0A8H5CJT0_9AGAR|nr:hypothetical protein D9611_001703 [Tulosesus angulatus]
MSVPLIPSNKTRDHFALKPVTQEVAIYDESLGETRNVGDSLAAEPLRTFRTFIDQWYLETEEGSELRTYSARLRSTLTEGPPNQLRNVLHIGCGTTEWIKAVAQDFPGCQALALDVTSNSEVEDDDFNEGLEHLYNSFDAVSIRLTMLRVRDYPRLVEHSCRALRQDGILEILEYDLHAYDRDHRIIPANTVDPLGTHPWWATLLAYIREAVDATKGNIKMVCSLESWAKNNQELGNVLAAQQWVPVVLGDHQEASADIDTCRVMNEHLLELRRPDTPQYARLTSICASKGPGANVTAQRIRNDHK